MAMAVAGKPDAHHAFDRPAIPPVLSLIVLLVVALTIFYLLPIPPSITIQGRGMLTIFVCNRSRPDAATVASRRRGADWTSGRNVDGRTQSGPGSGRI
jgi:hypothetical protein